MTFTDHLSAHDVADAYVKSVELAVEMGCSVYRVIDVRGAVSSYQDAIHTYYEVVKGVSAAAIYPKLAAVFVGQPDMASFFEARGARAFFETMDDALAFARAQVATPVAVS
jgi:hypothetical protein